MKNNLNVTLDELCTFAIIHGYTLTTGYFYGSPAYISGALGITWKEAAISIRCLLAKAYIIEEKVLYEGREQTVYKTSPKLLKKFGEKNFYDKD